MGIGTAADECPACVREKALCSKCERALGPKLKQPAWRWLIGYKRPPTPPPEPEPSVAAQKAIRKKNRQRGFSTYIYDNDGLTPWLCSECGATPVANQGNACGSCRADSRPHSSSASRLGYTVDDFDGDAYAMSMADD